MISRAHLTFGGFVCRVLMMKRKVGVSLIELTLVLLRDQMGRQKVGYLVYSIYISKCCSIY